MFRNNYVVFEFVKVMVSEQKEQFALESIIRGRHVYKQVWTLYAGEELNFCIDVGNEHGSLAVHA